MLLTIAGQRKLAGSGSIPIKMLPSSYFLLAACTGVCAKAGVLLSIDELELRSFDC